MFNHHLLKTYWSFPPSLSSYIWMLTPQCEKQTQSFPREHVAHVGANHTHAHTHIQTHKYTHKPACTPTHSALVCISFGQIRVVNKCQQCMCLRVCVQTACGATILYNTCESVAFSSNTPGVFAFPERMKTLTYVHMHRPQHTVQVL